MHRLVVSQSVVVAQVAITTGFDAGQMDQQQTSTSAALDESHRLRDRTERLDRFGTLLLPG